MCKIKSIGNQIVPKSDDVIRIYFENVNRLPTSKSGRHSDKVNRLRHLWSNINVNFTSLVETQINPSLRTKKDSLHATMFENQLATSILSNNKNKLTGRRQKCVVMSVVKGECSKHATYIGAAPTGLGRWN